MKKTLITTLLCVVSAASLMAQGRVNFANTGGTSATATPLRINNGTAAAPGAITQILGTASTAQFGLGPASVEVRLYAGLTSSSLAPVMIGTAANVEFVLNTANTALATVQGSFPGGTVVPLTGSPLFLQFTAISIATGQLPRGAYYGESSIIQVTPALSPAAATVLFSATPSASQWNGLTLYAVPEPSSMALAGLGAASLLIFRRRK